jgi:NAD-dependent deacetylase
MKKAGQEAVDRLTELLLGSRHVVAFTGAGISTGSGIPDFRGPGGVWSKRSPVYFDDFVSSEAARIEYWEYKLEGHRAFRDARPNAAHLALVELERAGRLRALVTQNIDGLHQVAGTSAEVLMELHGTNSATVCLGCGQRRPAAEALEAFERSHAPPRCGDCSELLKPGVVMFGESLDMQLLGRAFREAAACDLMLALGSSLVVTPAADVPLRAKERGAAYVIVNRGDTPHDRLATLRIDDDVSHVLSGAVQGMRDQGK